METLLFTRLISSFPLCLSVILSFSKILMLLAYFPKKKKNGTKNCILAPLMTCKETGDAPPLVVWLEEYRWEPNIKDWRTERERQREKNGRGWKMSNMTDLF